MALWKRLVVLLGIVVAVALAERLLAGRDPAQDPPGPPPCGECRP